MPRVISFFLLSMSVFGQASAPKPAKPAKPAVRTVSPDVATVIELLKGKMPESLILRTIKSEGKKYTLSTSDMLALQQAGASEAILNTLLDPSVSMPSSGTESSAVASAVPPVAVSSQPTPYPPDLSASQLGVRKRRLAIEPFQYAAVTHWVHYWFNGHNVNVGEGIRAMLTARMAQAKNITILERSKSDVLDKEKNMAGVKRSTKAKSGRMLGADCILMGDITIFGRDDKSSSGRESGFNQVASGLFGRVVPRSASQAVVVTSFNKEEKAVVAFALRIVDVETGEVLETAEARGESSRSSKNWSVYTAGAGTYQSNAGSMNSSNFQETIIGEATSDAVNKALALLDIRIPEMELSPREIEGPVVKISGNTPILGIGSEDGVARGDRFVILKVISEIRNPANGEILDLETTKVGEFVVHDSREKIATGLYGGVALDESYQKGYVARLSVQ